MPKPLALEELFGMLAANEVARSPNHFLFFLGSDAVFIEKPTIGERWYPRGETLSYTAQALTSLLKETAAAEVRLKSEALAYCSLSVDVLNGPTMLGSGIGPRIAEGVFLALRAVANNKKRLQFVGHSRGAVEAMLVIHELDRIKKALTTAAPTKTLRQILLESSSKATADAMALFFPKDVEGDLLENRMKLLRRMNELKTNPFLIDPVPGDTVWGLPGLTWHDPLFYERVPCDDYELLLCRDERSCGFYPIVPKSMRYTIVPGHHGSPMGNRYTQPGDDLPVSVKHLDTTGVQDLVLFKLFYFFNKTTGAFHQRIQEGVPLDLGHPALDATVNTFLTADEHERRKIMLDLYVKIQENDKAYRAFTKTSYSRFLGITADRCIHYQARHYRGLRTLLTEMHGQFVNIEHAMIYLNEQVHFPCAALADLEIQLTAINITLANIIAALRYDMVDDERSKLLAILKHEEGCKTFLGSLSMIADSVGHKYLSNHLPVAEKIRLKTVVEQPFTMLGEALKNPDSFVDISIIKACQDILQEGIKTMAETHYQAILHQIDELFQQAELFLAPHEQFAFAFNQFLLTLTVEDGASHALLTDIKSRLIALDPIKIDTVQQALSEALEALEDLEALDPIKRERIKALLLGKPSMRLKAYFEAYQYSVDQYLSRTNQLYDAVEALMCTYPQLLMLVGEKTLEIQREELSYQIMCLIKLAAHLLRESKYDVYTRPENVSETFYRLTKEETMMLLSDNGINDAVSDDAAMSTTHLASVATGFGLFAKRSPVGASKTIPDMNIRTYHDGIPTAT